jgi:hypothetical protein
MESFQIENLAEAALMAATIIFIAYSPIARAIGNRILHGKTPRQVTGATEDPRVEELVDEVSGLRHQLGEMQERVDFAERMIARSRAKGALGAGPEH